MIKSISTLKRKKGLTREQFLRYWKEVHGPMFLSKNPPGLRRYVQNHAVKFEGPEFHTDIDGIAEVWFDDVESLNAFRKWLTSDEAKEIREDDEHFIEKPFKFEKPVRFIAEEYVLKE